jgi:hypothetical protein
MKRKQFISFFGPDERDDHKSKQHAGRSERAPAEGAEHCHLNDDAMDDTDGQIHEQKPPPAEFPFNDQPEAPQEKHIPRKVHDVGVHEVAADPLEWVQAVPKLQDPGFHFVRIDGVGAGDEHRRVDDD